MDNGSSGGGQDPAQLAAYRGVAPGWYQDAGDPTRARYWDGATLSTQTQPVAPPPTPSVTATPAPAPSASPVPSTSVPSAPGTSADAPEVETPEPEQRTGPVKIGRLDRMSVVFARGMTRLLGRTN